MSAPLHIRLTKDERERLEDHRRAQGERSMADVIRRWIAMPPSSVMSAMPIKPEVTYHPGLVRPRGG